MEITEVQVKLIEKPEERLKASCTITLDGEFVIRDVKVIEGTNGLFVAMPSRKLADHCPRCGSKNHLRARFCNNCGGKLKEDRLPRRGGGRTQLHAEIAHPINSTCRERIQSGVLAEYQRAKNEAAQAPASGPGERNAPPATAPESTFADDVDEYDDFIQNLKSEAQRRRDKLDAATPFEAPARSSPVVREAPAPNPPSKPASEENDGFTAGLL